MPDLIDSDDEESLIEDKELDWRDMPHLMNLDNEINTGSPTNEGCEKEQIDAILIKGLQSYRELLEKKNQELIRVQVRERFNLETQRQLQKRQGPTSAKKLNIKLTFDEIAGIILQGGELKDIFWTVSRQYASITDRMPRIFVTQDGYNHMHWTTRMQWLDIVSVTKQGNVLQSMVNNCNVLDVLWRDLEKATFEAGLLTSHCCVNTVFFSFLGNHFPHFNYLDQYNTLNPHQMLKSFSHTSQRRQFQSAPPFPGSA
jgi:hypothetical protein